jgi:FkbM family methyltransferase
MTHAFDSAQLEALLSEPIASVCRREQSAFDELAAPFQDSLVLFGAGGLGRKTLAGLRLLGIEPLAFADNNPALWGKEVNGLRVLALHDAAGEFGQSAAFVITIWRGEGTDTMAERRQQLVSLNCSRVVPFGPLYWKYPNVFLPHYAFDLPHKVHQHGDEVRMALGLWSDDASRHEYLAQVRWRAFMDFDGLRAPVAHETYFPTDLTALLPDEVFVDCGAYDGDTIRTFLRIWGESFDKIIAYEPDPFNFQNLQHYASMLPQDTKGRIIIHPQALGARKSKVRFEPSGTEASAVGSGDLEVDCVTLDESLAGQRPSY